MFLQVEFSYDLLHTHTLMTKKITKSTSKFVSKILHEHIDNKIVYVFTTE